MRAKKSLLFALLGAALAALTACNPGPKYAKPPVQMPQAYKEAIPQEYKEGTGWKIAQPKDDQIRGNWWEIYNDPKLSALEVQVRVSNQTIAASEATFRQARALVRQARSGLFPTITAAPAITNSGFSRTSQNSVVQSTGTSTSTGSTTGTGSTTSTGSTTGTTGSTSTTTTTGTTTAATSSNRPSTTEFSLPFDVSYEVDLWHRVRNTIAADAFQAQASAGDLASVLLSTQAEVAQDYFEIRSLDAQRAVLEGTVTAYREALRLTRARYEGGISSEEDVSEAQTQLETALTEIIDLGVSRSQFEHAIAVLIGKPPADFTLAMDVFVPKPPPVPVSLPSELLERRPDIAAAERRVAAANAQIGVARAAYYPALTLGASGGLQTTEFTQWFTWPSRFWSIGPQLAQTLFDGGARRAITDQARAQYDQTVANYRQTVLTSFQNVEDYLAALRILSQEYTQQDRAVTTSKRTLELATDRYTGGVDSYLNVITAQTTVLNNQLTQVNLQLRQMTSSVQLIKALGGGWDISQLPAVKDLTAKNPSNSGLPNR